MNTIEIEQRVREVMPAAPRPRPEIRAGAPFELLIGLAALTADERPSESWVPPLDDCSAQLRQAVDEIGRTSGELWLHLLGIALELPAAAPAQALLAAVDALPARELRRHLVGVYVPAWRGLVGAETLERAAAGDAEATGALLRHDRYYAGRARGALARLLPRKADATKRRVMDVLTRFSDDVLAERERELVARLEADAREKRRLSGDLEAVIAEATRGYVYEPEPDLRRVVLVPHLAAAPWLLLCQHLDARIICYPAGPSVPDVTERAVHLGRALADEARIKILRRLARGEASLSELAEVAGVAKSTAHHHLAHLRAAGMVTLRGNARRYWYALRGDALAEARALLGDLFA